MFVHNTETLVKMNLGIYLSRQKNPGFHYNFSFSLLIVFETCLQCFKLQILLEIPV